MTQTIFFFRTTMPSLAFVTIFSEQRHFRRIYFFTVSTSSDQLILHSNQFDTTVAFSEWLFLQSCYFFGTATFSGLPLFKIATFLERNFYRAATSSIGSSSLEQLLFWRSNLFRVKISIEELRFSNRYFYTASNFNKASSSKEVVPLKNSFF